MTLTETLRRLAEVGDIEDFHDRCSRDAILALCAVADAARRMLSGPGGQFLMQHEPEVGLLADPECRELERALAALDRVEG